MCGAIFYEKSVGERAGKCQQNNEELKDRVRRRTEDYRIINVALQQEIAGHKKAKEDLQRTLDTLKNSVNTTINVMASAVEARDPYTAGHQIRSATLPAR